MVLLDIIISQFEKIFVKKKKKMKVGIKSLYYICLIFYRKYPLSFGISKLRYLKVPMKSSNSKFCFRFAGFEDFIFEPSNNSKLLLLSPVVKLVNPPLTLYKTKCTCTYRGLCTGFHKTLAFVQNILLMFNFNTYLMLQ